MKQNKWKKITSGILAVCLVATLLLSNQSFGVFADEKQDSAQTTQEDVNDISATDENERLEEDEKTDVSSQSDETDLAEKTDKENLLIKDDSEKTKSESDTVSEQDVNDTLSDENVIVFDLSKGKIVFKADKTYVGYDANGNVVTGAHLDSNVYEIKQSSSEAIANTIVIETENLHSENTEQTNRNSSYNIILNSVSIDSSNQPHIPRNTIEGETCEGDVINSNYYASLAQQQLYYQKGEIYTPFLAGDDTVSVNVTLVGNNYLYAQPGAGATLQYAHYPMGKTGTGALTINGTGSLEVKQTTQCSVNRGACIGGPMLYKTSTGRAGNGKIIFKGGTIKAETIDNSFSAAIGGGSCCPAEMPIIFCGSNIIAKSFNTSATIGAGGGSTGVGAAAHDIQIEDGNVTVYSPAQGVGIGGGTSQQRTGGDAKSIKISGGTVTVYGEDETTYGMIGGGTSKNLGVEQEERNGGVANITISGGIVTAGSIGGGSTNAPDAKGGNATIIVRGNAQVKTDSIGGGKSVTGTGGDASVTIEGGYLDVQGTIGGGDSDSGDGGNAFIYVSGGTLDCASIGGGNSKTGTPGSVTNTNQQAGVVVTGGILKSGTIGGGVNNKGMIGFATVLISGGNIQGQFVLANTVPDKQCKFTMTGGTIDNTYLLTDSEKYQMAQENGGAVYLSDPDGEVLISGGTIQNCKAELGGAVYMTAGTVKLSGTGKIQNCKATGDAENNKEAQGGAIYLENGTVNVSGGEISECSAVNGAAVYMQGGSMSVSGGSIKTNTAAESGGGAYLKSGNLDISDGDFIENTAKNGAGAYLAGGSLTVQGGKIATNTATESGGGAYLAAGNLDISDGDFSDNKAPNGAGAYLAGGNLNVNGNGTFNLNKASENGGAAYLANGTLTVNGGTISSNTATANGGGFYLAGGKLYITAGKIQSNKAKNGAGAYVADSTVRMFGGDFTGNQASDNGGGMYISSTSQAADVVIRSGNLINNSAGNSDTASDQGNGGAIAVVSSNSSHQDHVIIGLRKDHGISDYSTREYTSFSYEDEVDDNKEHDHAACPTIEKNTATGNGGGIYMSSSASVLDIYCLLEKDNTATKDATGGSIMSEGGKVNIGDIGDGGPGEDGKGLNNTEKAVGNVYIQSKMLVKGGDIKLFGNTDNPKFAESILVDIEKGVDDGTQKGSFNDYRYRAITGKVDYKIEYFENFQGSGKFESRQYDEGETIYAIGNMFEHTGWKILGWDENPNAINPTYKSGDQIPSSAWESVDSNTGSLTLYAIWKKITYTVHYEANITNAEISGAMSDQIFEYNDGTSLEQNGFKVKGKRFQNWNTQQDGKGTAYVDKAATKADGTPISTLTSVDGDEITLYAQWKDCTHTEADHAVLSYQVNEAAHSITEICDCEGYTATVQIAAENVYYDGATHPATLTGRFLDGSPTISYTYKANENGEYGVMPKDTTVPTEIGYYKATITATDADGKKSVSVEYQIKSPADAAAIEATIQKGEQFSAFTGTANCTVAQDDAFTVRYVVSGLNAGVNNGSDEESGTKDNKVYKTAPVLTVSQKLPAGTTIIMLADNAYWYNNDVSGKDEINLTSFRKMGGTEKDSFTYSLSDINDTQSYRFIVDFSGVSSENYLPKDTNLTIGLKYAYTNPSTDVADSAQDKIGTAEVTINAKADFTVTKQSDSIYQVNVLSDTMNTRYAGKNLVWKIALESSNVKLPSDAELTLSKTTGENTQTGKYALNANGEFVIPFEWTDGQNFTFALSSDQEALSGSNHSYQLKATLCVGSNTSDVAQPKAVEDQLTKVAEDIALQIPINNVPSMKISGTDKVLTKADSLKIHIKHTIDFDKYSVEAKIEKMQDGEYKGDNGTTKIDSSDKDYTLGLQSTTGAGCYRVCIVITNKDGNTVHLLSEEPYYYFIVQ